MCRPPFHYTPTDLAILPRSIQRRKAKPTASSLSALDSEDTAELAGLRRAAVSLADAVKIAEQRAAGKAMNAGLEQTNGKIVYEITIVKGDSARKIVIDPASGQLVSA